MHAVDPWLDRENRDSLIYILEASLNVHNANQFFVWSQGPLQRLLPHEVLVCGYDTAGLGDLRLRYFSSTPFFKETHFEAASNPRHGLFVKTLAHWRNTRRPCLLPNFGVKGESDVMSEENLIRLELRNLAAHGMLAPGGMVHSWFCLGRLQGLNARTAHFLELLTPCLSAAYSRAIASESLGIAATARVGNLLTLREVQVLALVRDGLSNADVAMQLGLSIMTAKNHVQNIRGKLNARTRGQAVAEAIRLGLIRPAREEIGTKE